MHENVDKCPFPLVWGLRFITCTRVSQRVSEQTPTDAPFAGVQKSSHCSQQQVALDAAGPHIEPVSRVDKVTAARWQGASRERAHGEQGAAESGELRLEARYLQQLAQDAEVVHRAQNLPCQSTVPINRCQSTVQVNRCQSTVPVDRCPFPSHHHMHCTRSPIVAFQLSRQLGPTH